MSADLHIHSIYSDGSMTPEELVQLAARKGIFTIALADHDTVDGIEPALQAGKKIGVELIPAIEFSTFRGKAEIHILGYVIDYNYQPLRDKIKQIFQARLNRARKMVSLLNQQGVKISFADVQEIAGDDYVGRPHIARAMVRAGYIKEMGQAFSSEYIGSDGRAYVPKYSLTPEEAISLIKEAGGLPVLAHPVFVNGGQPIYQKEIARLAEAGLEGVEVYHSKQNKEQSGYYKKVAADLGLLITGGSDFHGENSPGIELGDIKLPDHYVDQLKEAAGKGKIAEKD